MTSPVTSAPTSREATPEPESINMNDLHIRIRIYGRNPTILNVTLLPARVTVVTIQVTTRNARTNQWELSINAIQIPTPLLGRTVFQRIDRNRNFIGDPIPFRILYQNRPRQPTI